MAAQVAGGKSARYLSAMSENTGRDGAGCKRLAKADGPGIGAAPDRVEVWGTRIGRFLGAVTLVGLIIYLYVTYLR
jgi:hypothetical protein